MNRLISRDIDMEYLLYYPYMLEEFNPEVIQEKLDHMTPENLIVVYTSKTHEGIADETEAIYNTKFARGELDEGFLDELRNITFQEIEGDYIQTAEIDTKSKNVFIPYNCEQFEEEDEEPVVMIDFSKGDPIVSKI
mmetsp:Transcript_19277/g.17101  ORF Transcript_19277/g.17101 Transcript_19277/m.17101 type:complete len:136 (+) Transcript_19277:429-836(+)